MKNIKAALILLYLALLTYPAMAQRLVSRLSEQEISINSTFVGGTLTLFGNVEPDIGSISYSAGPFEVIIMIQGGASDKIVREKSRQFGVWLNASNVNYSGVPSFFYLLSTRSLDNIIDEEKLAELGINFEEQIQTTSEQTSDLKENYTNQLIRLMKESGTYGINTRAVSFHSPTFYSAKINLPSNVPNGTYLATTFLFENGELIDRMAQRFFVRTVGVEKFISNTARDFPLAYGLASVFLALFTGWLGGVAFRR